MIQERITALKKESELAEALLLQNLKSSPAGNLVSALSEKDSIANSNISSLTSPKALSVAKLVLTLGVGLSSTSKLSSALKGLISFLK